MKRVFFIAARLPFPLGGGPDFRTWMIADALAETGPVGVFGISYRAPEPPPRRGVEWWGTASKSAAVVHNQQGLGDGTWLKRPDWRPSAWYYHPDVETELADALAAFQPDVVVIEQLGLAEYISVARRYAPLVVLNNHNVETDLQRQLVDAEASPVEKMVRRQFAARTELLERETVAAVDQVWVCSDVDRSLLRELFDVGSEVVPNVVPVDDYRAIYEARDGSAPVGPALLYPAQFAYLPSENAAVFLINDVLPLVRERQPGATAVLAGREPGRRMLAAAQGRSAVTVTGAVPSMHPFFQAADVLVIPLREGGGTRLKALEGFACGLPVVSTAKGVEGIEAADGIHYLGAESAEEFADAILQASDPAVAAPIRRAAYELVIEHYSPAAVGRSVERAFAARTNS